MFFLPTNIESPRQRRSILWRTTSFGSSGLFQLFRMSPYPIYYKQFNYNSNYPFLRENNSHDIKWISGRKFFLTCNELDSSLATSIAGGASYLERSARQFSLSHLENFIQEMYRCWIYSPSLIKIYPNYNKHINEQLYLYLRRLTTLFSLFSGHSLQESAFLQSGTISSISFGEGFDLEAVTICRYDYFSYRYSVGHRYVYTE